MRTENETFIAYWITTHTFFLLVCLWNLHLFNWSICLFYLVPGSYSFNCCSFIVDFYICRAKFPQHIFSSIRILESTCQVSKEIFTRFSVAVELNWTDGLIGRNYLYNIEYFYIGIWSTSAFMLVYIDTSITHNSSFISKKVLYNWIWSHFNHIFHVFITFPTYFAFSQLYSKVREALNAYQCPWHHSHDSFLMNRNSMSPTPRPKPTRDQNQSYIEQELWKKKRTLPIRMVTLS